MSGLFHWAGGKGRIVDALMSHIDIHRNCDLRFAPPCVGSHKAPRWIEPFVGGGAVALEAMRRGLASRYVLADGSADVMSVYATLLDQPAELMRELHDFAQLTEAEQRLIFAEQKPAYDRHADCNVLAACSSYTPADSMAFTASTNRASTTCLLARRLLSLILIDYKQLLSCFADGTLCWLLAISPRRSSKPDPATSSTRTHRTWARTRPTRARASTRLSIDGSRNVCAMPLHVALCAGCQVATATRPALCMAVSHM